VVFHQGFSRKISSQEKDKEKVEILGGIRGFGVLNNFN